MLTIVGLLKGWETAVEQLQERSPPAVTTFLNLGLIEVVEDFVARGENTPYAIDARDN